MAKRDKALRPSDKELDELVEVSPSDIEKAKQFWRKNAPVVAKDILDAESEIKI